MEHCSSGAEEERGIRKREGCDRPRWDADIFCFLFFAIGPIFCSTLFCFAVSPDHGRHSVDVYPGVARILWSSSANVMSVCKFCKHFSQACTLFDLENVPHTCERMRHVTKFGAPMPYAVARRVVFSRPKTSDRVRTMLSSHRRRRFSLRGPITNPFCISERR